MEKALQMHAQDTYEHVDFNTQLSKYVFVF